MKIFLEKQKSGEVYTVLDAYKDFKRPFLRLKVEDELGIMKCFHFVPFIHKKICDKEVKRVYRKGYTVCDNHTTYIVI